MMKDIQPVACKGGTRAEAFRPESDLHYKNEGLRPGCSANGCTDYRARQILKAAQVLSVYRSLSVHKIRICSVRVKWGEAASPGIENVSSCKKNALEALSVCVALYKKEETLEGNNRNNCSSWQVHQTDTQSSERIVTNLQFAHEDLIELGLLLRYWDLAFGFTRLVAWTSQLTENSTWTCPKRLKKQAWSPPSTSVGLQFASKKHMGPK